MGRRAPGPGTGTGVGPGDGLWARRAPGPGPGTLRAGGPACHSEDVWEGISSVACMRRSVAVIVPFECIGLRWPLALIVVLMA